MTGEPIDDVLDWAKKLSSWKQDALRRLAIANDLTEGDLGELLGMVKKAAGLSVVSAPPPAVPFERAHFGGGKHQPIILKGIANAENINRLVPKASLTFNPKTLTIIYGRNGSGKSGFVRILRTACRTRVENPAKLKVLADVYGTSSGPQTAEIIIDTGTGDIPIAWSPGQAASPHLMQVAVFDSASAQLYVDGGNQIRFLPFGLALPHRLNGVCLGLKHALETERAREIGNKISLTSIAFAPVRNTTAQQFDKAVSKITTNLQIDAATTFGEANQERLDKVTAVLSAGAAAAADVTAFAKWAENLAAECAAVETTFTDEQLEKLTALRSAATTARGAATVAAGALFTDEPLLGVGSDTWRVLWAAARDYSVSEAYAGEAFPVVSVDQEPAACVLCQQPLLHEGATRLQRFQKYMDDTVDKAATAAEKAVANALTDLNDLTCLRAPDFADRLEQIRKRDSVLADLLAGFQAAALTRRDQAIARLGGEAYETAPPMVMPLGEVQAFALRLKAETDALAQAGDADERDKLTAEKAELEDRKILSANKSTLVTRRDLLVVDAAYEKALTDVQTKGITQRANELLDTHLTTAVVSRFDAERTRFDIMHLNVGLARKSDKTKAEFEVDPQTKLTKVTSEILSEGEQRALALAGFLTEVALTDGSGAIVIDDPVSSLDRDRSVKVAERISEEALSRQVIVFTHDMVFFNELCRTADAQGIEPATIALFSDKSAAGKIDAAGMPWKGLNVAKRIGRIKADSAQLSKLHTTSPADYEIAVKNLYGRLRDTYERVVEEIIFMDIVRRGTDVIQTQLLRYVSLSHELAIRFHEGMTRANTHSHDNPATDTVPVPTPSEFASDLAEIEDLIGKLKAEGDAAEAARPQMKPKK